MADREWDDYSRAIDPPLDAAARVRARLDRTLAARARTPVTVEPSPVSRAAAIIVFAKSSVLTLGLAIGGLGALHVGARVIAGPPAEPPMITNTKAPEPDPSRSARVPEPPAAAAPPLAAPDAPPPAVQQPVASEPANPRTPRAAAPAAPSASDALKAEVALISTARQAVASGDRRAGLAALDAHARSFPSGAFAEERDAIAATLRCAEPGADRDAIARAFASARPRSPHLARVRATCNESPTDSAASPE